jgi:2-keto-4-pentenoate hydratase/2-oxohepta-3-ene-1,7-dioic acid hydratase in catechol pathway
MNTTDEIRRYVRYLQAGQSRFGMLRDDSVLELDGNFLTGGSPTGRTAPLSEVSLLAPVVPLKVLAVGLNYRSHLGARPAPAEPGIFPKLSSSIIGTGDEIVFPPGAEDVHYEGELVVVIGKQGKSISKTEALDYILGVTCGNDISERRWQKGDLQWFRAKGSDTFGPIGPAVVQGLNFADLQLTTRLNGDVRQSQRTSDLIFTVPEIVSYVSRFATLAPGDLIFTGTPGTTQPMKAGDIVEVEIEGIGILRNRVRGNGNGK